MIHYNFNQEIYLQNNDSEKKLFEFDYGSDTSKREITSPANL